MVEPIRIGVIIGGGPAPGYRWNVWLIDLVFEEAIDLLKEMGYEHLAAQVRELALQDDPTHSETVDVRPIETFYEIRDKGAPFGGANIRLFFGIDETQKAIIPLGTIKKQNNGKTPSGDRVRMRRRFRNYLRGDYGVPPNAA